MKGRQKQCGMSVFGVVIVMVIVGVLLAAVAPMLLSKHTYSMAGSDRKALDAARTALIGYAFSTGNLPAPVDASGVPVIGTAGLMPPSAGPGAIPSLGVNNWGIYGKENLFRMDVNDALASLSAASGVKDLCSVAQAQMATPGAGPRTCQDFNDHTTACAVGNSAPMAFVLYSTGNDHIPNQENATAANRIYEGEFRGIDNSPNGPLSTPQRHYDDQVVSYPLSGLVSDCAKLSGLPVCNLDASPLQVISGCPTTLTASCSKVPTTYNWSTPPGWPSTIATSGVIPASTTPYSVSGTNEFGTGATVSKTVTVTAASCTISSVPSPANITVGQTAQFTATCNNSPTSYNWSGVSGVSATNTFTTLTSVLAGTYAVQVSASGTCGSLGTGSATLTVNPSAATPVCTMTPLTLNLLATNNGSITVMCTNNPTFFTWNIPCFINVAVSIPPDQNGQNCQFIASALPNVPGTNTVTATATNGVGSGSASATASVYAACASGQKRAALINNSGSIIHYSIGGSCGSTTPLANGGSVVTSCNGGGNKLFINSASNCAGTAILSTTNNSLNNIDSAGNNDGMVNCAITGTGAGNVNCN